MNLLNLRSQIATAERGAGILEDKRGALVKELLRIYDDVVAGRHTLRDNMQKATVDLFHALSMEGREGVISAALASRRDVSVDIVEKNIWGVIFPEIHHETMVRRLDARGYSFVTTSSAIDAASKHFEILLNLILMVASTETHMKHVGTEVKKTTRRINAITEIFIPKAEEQMEYINRSLDEREREDILRLKKLKAKRGEERG